MSISRTRSLVGLALGLMTTAAVAGTASVQYDHPENFTETREVKAFAPWADTDYLGRLKAYIEKRAQAAIAPDESMAITITDIDRAGSYLPSVGRGQPVRVVEATYPPRITLHFRLLDGQGRLIAQGERKLTDLGFLYDNTGGTTNTDPLRYEKRLIDRWLARGPGKL